MIVKFAEAFSGMFAACGQALCDNIVGLLPSVVVLLMVFNTICHLIGADRIERFSKFLAKNRILAYTVLPFIASIVIGTIQLGSTVDYAILMTTRYRTERAAGKDRKEAVYTAHSTSIASVMVSAFSFFAATFGVGLYSEIDMISSLCTLMARGALISMITVMFILPALLYAADRVIIYTSIGFRPKKRGRTYEEKTAYVQGQN